LPANIFLPIFERSLPDGIEVGTNLLVEFDPDSAWYEASLTIVAQALRGGHKALYHTFQHLPADIEHDLTKFGLDLTKLRAADKFQIVDSFAVQTGGLNRVDQNDPIAKSLKVPELSIAAAEAIRKERSEGIPDADKGWVHVDDNTGIMTRYNPENTLLDFWRTRHIPITRVAHNIMVFSILNGTTSENFRAQFETLSDGIIDLRREDREGEVAQLFRVRKLRGKKVESRWQQLLVSETGEVTIPP
jgi:KaiC/GvpD/RAD55 family RecA-like ATPase